MADTTKIQWCHSTINPIMGCLGCELFPEPAEVLDSIDLAVGEVCDWKTGQSKKIFKRLACEAFRRIKSPEDGHSRAVTTTNIWHLRIVFLQEIHAQQGAEAAKRAEAAIRRAITCYAASDHLKKGRNILKPDNGFTKGFAPTFERVTQFEGRVLDMAGKKDLLGKKDSARPWISGLPRLVFVSDMGDAFSRESDFDFLEREAVAPIKSEEGRRHLWLWLSKRPDRMGRFGKRIGGFPDNVCCMTTVTGPDKLHRVDELRSVPAAVRGLSLEPLWETIPPEKLDLTGIHWMIIGGESGTLEYVRPFHLEWVEQMREKCRKSGVAFFVKQLGRRPVKNGSAVKLKDPHGGEWDEWDPALRMRNFPQYFYDYRKTAVLDAPLSQVEQQDFHRLNEIVSTGMRAGVDAATALFEIRERRLYRAGFATFEEYCQNVHSLTRQYANRLIIAGRVRAEMETIVSKNGLPLPVLEGHLRALARVKDPHKRVEIYSGLLGEAKRTGCLLTAERIEARVDLFVVESKDGGDEPTHFSPSERLRIAADLLADLEAYLAQGADVEGLLAGLRDVLTVSRPS
jgi:protein gp37